MHPLRVDHGERVRLILTIKTLITKCTNSNYKTSPLHCINYLLLRAKRKEETNAIAECGVTIAQFYVEIKLFCTADDSPQKD